MKPCDYVSTERLRKKTHLLTNHLSSIYAFLPFCTSSATLLAYNYPSNPFITSLLLLHLHPLCLTDLCSLSFVFVALSLSSMIALDPEMAKIHNYSSAQ